MNGLQFNLDQDFQHGIEVKLDPALTSGSLILLEPARDDDIGIPSRLVNYAALEAQRVVGSNIDHLEIKNTLNLVSGAMIERTEKGGLHCIFPQTVSSMSSRANFGALLPDSIKEYVNANLTHKYYLSLHAQITRNAATGSESVTLAGLNAAETSAADVQTTPAIFQAQATLNVAGGRNVAATLGRTVISVPNQFNPFMCDVAHNGLVHTQPSMVDTCRNEIFSMGALNRLVEQASGKPSWIMWRLHLIDLTVADISYAQAHALEQAVSESRFNNGGIYANDTWTIPT